MGIYGLGLWGFGVSGFRVPAPAATTVQYCQERAPEGYSNVVQLSTPTNRFPALRKIRTQTDTHAHTTKSHTGSVTSTSTSCLSLSLSLSLSASLSLSLSLSPSALFPKPSLLVYLFHLLQKQTHRHTSVYLSPSSNTSLHTDAREKLHIQHLFRIFLLCLLHGHTT